MHCFNYPTLHLLLASRSVCFQSKKKHTTNDARTYYYHSCDHLINMIYKDGYVNIQLYTTYREILILWLGD